MYSVPQSRQLTIFLCALGAGFLLGILYDIMRTLRLSFTSSKAALVIFDITYFVLSGFLSFLFILATNKGEVRFYIIAGEIIGWLFYYFSFGVAVIKITDALIAFLNKAKAVLFKIISAPFRLALSGLNRLYEKISRISKKTEKNSQKIRKKYLQKLRIYVYNLLGVLSTRGNTQKKGGRGFGKHKSKKEKETKRSG